MLLLVPSPDREHQDIAGEIFFHLKLIARDNGGYAAMAPLGVALSEHTGFEPDVVYVSPGREAILTRRGVEGAPDLVVEVLSPSTRAYNRGTKLRSYLEGGIREVWLVDPDARTVSVISRDADTRVSFGDAIPSRVVDVGSAGLAK